ncbi:endonuclease domain-containing protein [Mycobacterium sp. WMMD1722]|uniref:endonuclease domain-containing protein n=1 Tax=Mycobacterium sp. WMMD1722 TaxID=3404117 RepID=UPI003BF54A98
MGRLVVGSEALASGRVTRQMLRSEYVKIHHNVYAPAGLPLDARIRAEAAWLWSGGKAVLVGSSAAALLGTRWLPPDGPAEIARVRTPSPPGITVHSGVISDDELRCAGPMRHTTASRTAYDLGRRLRGDEAIIRVDAILNATRCSVEDVQSTAARYPGARGIRRLRATLDLVDPGAESPQETRLRLVLIRGGLPRPVTQIPVMNEWGRVVRRIDMGWPEAMVGVEYDGEQHFVNADDYARDIDRLEFLAEKGWQIVRVSAAQLRYRRGEIVTRARTALTRRAGPQYL